MFLITGFCFFPFFSPLAQTILWLVVQILVAGLKFFLGKDEDEKQNSDSESEASVLCWDCFLREILT